MSSARILILKMGETLAPVKARYADFDTWIAKGLGLTTSEIDVASVFFGDALPNAAGAAGVVVTGSPAMVTDREGWSEAAAAWLGEVVQSDATPVLGICYGHQLLAHGLGGHVGVNPNGREMGTVEVEFKAGAGDLFPAGSFPAHFSHVESVLEVPAGAEVLATTPLDPHSVIRFGERQWGVQYHPEFDVPILQGYVEARREILVREGIDPDKMIADSRETPDQTRVLERFAKLSGVAS